MCEFHSVCAIKSNMCSNKKILLTFLMLQRAALLVCEEKGGFFSAVKINNCHGHFHLLFVVVETKGTFVLGS